MTLCTGLEAGDLHAIIGTAQQFLPHTRAIAAQVGGPLVGNKNTGRIYLAIYPESSKHWFAQKLTSTCLAVTTFCNR